MICFCCGADTCQWNGVKCVWFRLKCMKGKCKPRGTCRNEGHVNERDMLTGDM